MKNKICVITGANRGLGKAVSLELARQGATIIMICRDQERGRKAQKEIIEETNNTSIEVMHADLADKNSIKKMSESLIKKYHGIDILVNNAAVYKSILEKTPEGLETMFAVNHMGVFRLSNLLLGNFNSGARIFMVTAPSTTRLDFDDLQGEKKFNSFHAFGASKMCNLLFTYELAEKLAKKNIYVNAFFPGLMKTGLMNEASPIIRWMTRILSADPKKAAKSLVYLLSSSDLKGVTGKFFKNSKEIKSSPYSYTREPRKLLWEKSSLLN